MKRIAGCIGLLAAFNFAFATPVLAQPPPANDTYDNRTVIPSLPFADSVDTTKAGSDADDAELNAQCGAPATDASVWYELTAASDGGAIVDVSASTYSAGVIVATGSPGTFSVVTCGPGAVLFGTIGGETYTILAFDDQVDGGGNGGTLNIVVDEAPPPPVVDMTVDPVGNFNSQTGSATITGTVTCTGEVALTFLDVQVQQRVGRFLINGFGSTAFTCDGATHVWSVEVFAQNGTFKGGHTMTVAIAVACTETFICGSDFEEVIVRLRG